MKVRKAVIPVAGFATRFLPACKSIPKCMLNVVDKPIIQYIVDEAVDAGIEEILLIVGRKKDVVIDYFSEDVELKNFLKERGKESFISQIENLSGKAKIHFIEQDGGAKGLGHAIYQAKGFVGDEPFAIMYGDVIMKSQKPCLKEIIEQHERLGGSVIGVQQVEWSEVSKYGNVDGNKVEDRLYKVNTLVEKPKQEEAKTNLAIMDRHVLMPEIFNVLADTKPGVGGEIQVTDAYSVLAKTKEGLYAYEYESDRFDSGDKLGFVKATINEALSREDLKQGVIDYIKNLQF